MGIRVEAFEYVRTLVDGAGLCRDFTHLGITFAQA
jgi:hypothetical protein